MSPILEYDEMFSNQKVIKEKMESLKNKNILVHLIDDKHNKFNVAVIDGAELLDSIASCKKVKLIKLDRIYLYNKDGHQLAYILYGGSRANAFQRGIWGQINSKFDYGFCHFLSDDWVDYKTNNDMAKNLLDFLIDDLKFVA